MALHGATNQSCREPDYNPSIFRSIEPLRVNYARKIRERFSSCGCDDWRGSSALEISRCFDSPGSFRCFGCNRPSAVTTVIFAARPQTRRAAPPRCNQFRRRITPLAVISPFATGPGGSGIAATEIRSTLFRRFVRFDEF